MISDEFNRRANRVVRNPDAERISDDRRTIPITRPVILDGSMRAPLSFTCTADLERTADEVAEQILDVDAWRTFRGWGPIPGIRAATFRRRTDAIVGSEIAVENDDGSRHVETITEWRPRDVITLRMAEFTPPLANLASHIVETWRFTPRAKGCHVARSFELHPKSTMGAVLLRGVAPMLEQATARHLRDLDAR